MERDHVIAVENVTKRFRLRGPGGLSLKSAVIAWLRDKKPPTFEALRDVTFEVRRGETLGIIGANGAGKSTLFSIISGIIRPTSGRVKTTGTISSLLELGAGFHPELTGRENVFLYGALMGIPARRMKERFDAIVDFAGIGSFIDEPVKHYSSGMYVRLAFSIAVEVDPDILLLDEVLAVGDAEFQAKCIEKIRDFRRRGRTMLMISHDLRTIQSISDRILLLDQGRIQGLGDPAAMVAQYETLSAARQTKSKAREWGTGDVRIEKVVFLDSNGNETDHFESGRPLDVLIKYVSEKPVEAPVFGFSIATENGLQIFGSNTQIECYPVPPLRGPGAIRLRIENLPMASGVYLFSFSVHSADHKVNYHRLDNVFPIHVRSEKPFEGCCRMPVSWRVEK